MTHSINFNGVDLSSYDLTVLAPGHNEVEQKVKAVQLRDTSVPFLPIRTPKTIDAEVIVTGTSRADLDSNLANIKKYSIGILSAPAVLKFDSLPLRFWNAIMLDLKGDYNGLTAFEGVLSFFCSDPRSYHTTESDHNYSINSDPDTFADATGGTTFVYPVYTLTAGQIITDGLIKVENLDTGEELQWTGSLAASGTLVIDSERMLVSKGSTPDMASVTGQWPRMIPGSNSFKVTGIYISVNGNMNFLYRNTYL